MTAALVEPRALQARIDDFRICDIRWSLTRPGEGRSIYREGHIPGAVYVDLDQDLAARGGFGRHPLPTVSEFASTPHRTCK